jgi:subtilisin family serine protease
MPTRSHLALGLALAVSCQAARASAQLELGRAWRGLSQAGARELPRAWLAPNGRVAVLAEYPAEAGFAELVAGRYRPLWLRPEELESYAADQPELKLHWAPPRHALLDQAQGWLGTPSFRKETGLTGKGVVVGIVDTGLDVTHRDLRDADGKTRIRYLLDFSRRPADRQPELEAEYGCTDDTECAIYSAADLDELLNNGITGDEPNDVFGHGTHVASLAAGNGLSSKVARYIGTAPEATIFGARVSRSGDGSILDPDIITATRFVFEQAEQLGMPAVVNLSLGSDFGAHDGSSALEQGLASFVGPEHPGRAIVVAAGNSGDLYTSLGSSEPAPYGIHTEVHVPRESPVEIPILTPSAAQGALRGGTVFAWLGFRPGDELAVALDADGDSLVPDIEPGHSTTFSRDGYEASIFNGASEGSASLNLGAHDAVVIIDGNFEPGQVFTLRLKGHGTVNLWLDSTGGASRDLSVGALFPRGERQGTINVPGSHPSLIAVGSTVNRNRWRDYKGQPFLIADSKGSSHLAGVDGTAATSAAGPNALGVMKPDIVAPGMYVIGALAASADPRTNGGVGVFASSGRCGTPDYECFVADDGKHAVTSGTSMSAPLVAGAIALLFEKRPDLTQNQVRALLQAGAKRPTGAILDELQAGPGELDLMGTLAALDAEASPIERLPGNQSRIALAAAYVHPDPAQPLVGVLELRDDDDRLADGFDERRLGLEVTGGSVSQPPLRVAPGLYAFQVSAQAGSGGERLALSLTFDGQSLARRELPIGTDRWLAEGAPLPHGGCALSRAPAWGSSLWAAVLLLSTLARRRYMVTRYTVQAAGSKGCKSGSNGY